MGENTSKPQKPLEPPNPYTPPPRQPGGTQWIQKGVPDAEKEKGPR